METIKPTANISFPFNHLKWLGGPIWGEYEWMGVTDARHRFKEADGCSAESRWLSAECLLLDL